MFRIRYILLLLIIASCINNQGSSDSEVKTVNIQSDPIVENYDSLLDSLIPKLKSKLNVPAVAIGVIQKGELVLDSVYGKHQAGKKAPANTIFNVASVTKPVVAAGIVKLAEKGNWDLDEPVAAYWTDPDLENDSLASILTSRHLLTHSAGFNTNWREQSDSGKLKISTHPGKQFYYSGEGFEYLRKALENKFNQDLGAIMDSVLFDPLNMKDATLNWIKDSDTTRFARWHNGEGEEYKVKMASPNANAADDLLITVNDMSKFMIALMDNSFLKEEYTRELFKEQLKKNENSSMALGWHMVPDKFLDGTKAIYHYGSDTGTHALVMMFPERESGLIIFTNGDNGLIICNEVVKTIVQDGTELIQLMNWSSTPPTRIELDNNILQSYAGNYVTSLRGRIMNTSIEDGGLKIAGQGIPELVIYPKSKNEFFPADFERIFNFSKNEEGNMSFKLYDEAENVILSGVKEE